MSSAPAVHRLQHRCRFCGHFRPLEEFVCGPVIGQCLTCLDWHRKALEMLCGNLDARCTECGLVHEDALGDQRLYLHRKDGCYQLLCRTCSDRYEAKRADQFGLTPHGLRNKGATCP